MVHEILIPLRSAHDQGCVALGIAGIHVDPGQGQSIHRPEQKLCPFLVRLPHGDVLVDDEVEVCPAVHRPGSTGQPHVHLTGQDQVCRLDEALVCRLLHQLVEFRLFKFPFVLRQSFCAKFNCLFNRTKLHTAQITIKVIRNTARGPNSQLGMFITFFSTYL